jgi:thiamine biosynthesis protein ThiS
MMRLLVNGEQRQVRQGSGLAELLVDLDVESAVTVVVRNGEVVPRDRLGDVVLAEGDVLELVRIVGGG